MKAFQLVDYGTVKTAFKEVDIPLPNLLDAEDVLIKVHAFGLNYADVMARKGLYRATPPLPCVLGYEVVGEVIKIKDSKYAYLIGKRVIALTRFGGYAEYAKSTVKGVVEIPDSITNGSALALATQYCTAHFALCQEMNLFPNDVVLIHAASGGVGTALTQLAKLQGCKVIGLTRSPKKVEYLKNNGVDFPIVTTQEDYFSLIKRHPEFSNPTAIFNAVGGKTVKKDIRLLGPGGKFLFFGISDRGTQRKGLLFTILQLMKIGKIHPAILLLKSKSIIGLNLLLIADEKPERVQHSLKEVLALAVENKVQPNAEHAFSWGDLPVAHDGFEKGLYTGKIFIDLNL